jgi:hypothetical protein
VLLIQASLRSYLGNYGEIQTLIAPPCQHVPSGHSSKLWSFFLGKTTRSTYTVNWLSGALQAALQIQSTKGLIACCFKGLRSS